MVLDPIPQSLPVHFFGSRPQPPTSPQQPPSTIASVSDATPHIIAHFCEEEQNRCEERTKTDSNKNITTSKSTKSHDSNSSVQNQNLNLNLYCDIPRNLSFSIRWILGMLHFRWKPSELQLPNSRWRIRLTYTYTCRSSAALLRFLCVDMCSRVRHV